MTITNESMKDLTKQLQKEANDSAYTTLSELQIGYVSLQQAFDMIDTITAQTVERTVDAVVERCEATLRVEEIEGRSTDLYEESYSRALKHMIRYLRTELLGNEKDV